jgi:hypothetical protein
LKAVQMVWHSYTYPKYQTHLNKGLLTLPEGKF